MEDSSKMQDLNSNQVEASSNEESKFMDYENFSTFYDSFSSVIKETVASSTKIPMKSADIDYYLTCPSFNQFFQSQNERVLKIMGRVLKLQGIKKSNVSSSKLDDEERMDLLVDINDQMIEKLGIQLDEIQGLRKKTETELKLTDKPLNLTSRNINTSWNKNMGMVVNKSLLQTLQSTNNTKTVAGTSGQNELSKKIVNEKPQKFFKDQIDNSNLPFLPKLREKSNALIPLPDIFGKLSSKSIQINQQLFEDNLELLENPYIYEIDQFKLDESIFKQEKKSQNKLSSSFDETNYKYIDSLDDFLWLCNYLGKENRSRIKEIAVDLEHHSYRSFLGFTCLMQISTRYDDFIIDTIKLRSEIYRLNEVFSDWTLLKVLHGADSDIEWLQKDFGIYIVNMFDTGQAARILQYPHFSLSYLLQKFCNINAQKQYQLADWRQRPLSEALIRYAREDTHFLLHIYDQLVNELISSGKNINENVEQSSLFLVFEKSKLLCKKTFRKPLFYSKGFLNLCQNNTHLNAKQMKALHDLYTWRDKVARDSDESCEYVLKNHQLLKIAELLPREIYGILALCNPLSSIVETNVHDMLEIVKESREYKGTNNMIEIGMNMSSSEKSLNNLINKLPPYGLNKTQPSNLVFLDQKASNNAMDSIVHLAKYDPDNIINCPHDFPHKFEQQNDSMDTTEQTDTNVIEEVSKLHLKDLLIKPNNKFQSNFAMPRDLNAKHVSLLNDLFTKTYSSSSLQRDISSIPKSKTIKLEEKVKEIKSSIKSPFEFFLPSGLRKFNSEELNQEKNTIQKWSLLKSVDNQSNDLLNSNNEHLETIPEDKSTENDTNMIPLKNQYRQEKYSLKNKKKKFLKNVDFTDAIIEYNKTKMDKVNALGANDPIDEIHNANDQSKKINDLINKRVAENLKSVLDKVKVGEFAFSGATSSTTEINQDEQEEDLESGEKNIYDSNDMNKMFSKPVNKDNKYDPSSKLRQNKFDKINKRRQTNTISRTKHSLTLTYKNEPNK